MFEAVLIESLLIDVMLERYEEQGTDKSKIFTIEFFAFLTGLLTDFNSIYFKYISGLRLDALLSFIDINKKDYEIVSSYAKFLNVVG